MTIPEKRILMIVFHHPPLDGASGIHRTVAFKKYISAHGWHVLTVVPHPRAYGLNQAPIADDGIYTAFALDTSRNLAWKGKYIKLFALPDKWVTWFLGAIPLCLKLAFKQKPTVIWSTYPIATAHLIGLVVSKVTGIPWIADFRDPMTDNTYPYDRLTRSIYQWIERKVIYHCTLAVFATEGTRDLYTDRYPQFRTNKFIVISNGYNEADFSELNIPATSSTPEVTLIHSGHIYEKERNPIALFNALKTLRQKKLINRDTLKVVFRGIDSGHFLHKLVDSYELNDIIRLEPAISHANAIKETLGANGLIIMQAENCNHQIPAKAYEYLRTYKPILAITDKQGETANLLQKHGCNYIADINSSEEISNNILALMKDIKLNKFTSIDKNAISLLSRENRSAEFLSIINKIHKMGKK